MPLRKNNTLAVLTFALLLTQAPITAIAAATSDTALLLQADSAEINTQKGLSTYHGNVQLKRGTLVITGDTLIVQSHEGKLQKASVTGKPATFSYQSPTEKQPIRGESPQLEYVVSGDIIKLTGGTTLWQNGNTMKGNEITYLLKTGVVNAQGSEQKNQRIEIMLLPDTLTPPKTQP